MDLFNASSEYICWLLGTGYPAYATFKCLSQNDPVSKQKWLSFWAVYSPVLIVENLPFATWLVPLYYQTKVLLLCWMLMPRFQGAVWLYSKIVRPILSKYQPDIDSAIQAIKSKMSSKMVEWRHSGMHLVRKHSVDLLVKGQTMLINLNTPPALPAPAPAPASAPAPVPVPVPDPVSSLESLSSPTMDPSMSTSHLSISSMSVIQSSVPSASQPTSFTNNCTMVGVNLSVNTSKVSGSMQSVVSVSPRAPLGDVTNVSPNNSNSEFNKLNNVPMHKKTHSRQFSSHQLIQE